MKKSARSLLVRFVSHTLPLATLITFSAQTAFAEDFSFPGLSGTVTVTEDQYGVPSIRGTSETDVAFVQGYIHARDRFFQMDYFRKVASGKLAELLGQAALPTDVQLRTLGLGRAALKSWQNLDAETKGILQAYANGVNAWLGSSPLPPEYLGLELTKVEPWQPVDSLAYIKLVAWDLAFSLGDIENTINLLTYQAVGEIVGVFDGVAVGVLVGELVGEFVGLLVGEAVGVLVALAHRDAAGGDDGIGTVSGLPEGLLDQLAPVAHHTKVDDLDTKLFQHAIKCVAVAVMDLAGTQRFTDRSQFIAGGKEGHLQTAPDACLAQAERGQHTDVRCRQQPARAEHLLAGRKILAGLANILPAAMTAADTYRVAVTLDLLLHDHGVQAVRHFGASHDSHTLLSLRAAVVGPSGPCRADHLQRRSRTLGG